MAQNEGDDLSADKLYRACMAGAVCLAGQDDTPALSETLWPHGVETARGWPSGTLVDESLVMTDEAVVAAIMGKWMGFKLRHAPDSLTKDEQTILQSGLRHAEGMDASPEKSAMPAAHTSACTSEAGFADSVAPAVASVTVSTAFQERASPRPRRPRSLRTFGYAALLVTREASEETGYESGGDDARADELLPARRASVARQTTRAAALSSGAASSEAADGGARLRGLVRRPTFQRGLQVNAQPTVEAHQFQMDELGPRAKSVAKAEAKVLATQCVRWTRLPAGQSPPPGATSILDKLGNVIIAEKFPLWPRFPRRRGERLKIAVAADGTMKFLDEKLRLGISHEHSRREGERPLEYGVPVAFILLLRFHTRCALAFALLCLVAIPDMMDNQRRSYARDECRILMRNMSSGGLMRNVSSGGAAGGGVGGGASSTWMHDCGYAGLPVMPLAAVSRVSSQSARGLSIGACMEYHERATVITPNPCLPGWDALFGLPCKGSRQDTFFVYTPDASYCMGDGLWRTSISPTIQVAILFLFVLYLARFSHRVVLRANTDQITAANYGAMITGLQRGEPADTSVRGDGQEKLLLDDLATLGFRADEIDHIEIGRDCRKEIKLQERLEQIKVRESEIHAKKNLRKRLSVRQRGRFDAEHAQAWADMAAAQRDLQEIRRHPQNTTGHAFVCFRLEARRDDLLNLFERPSFLHAPVSFSLRALFGERCMEWCMGGKGGAPDMPELKTVAKASAPWRGMTVDIAPEPRDIYWENLVLDGRWARQITNLSTALLIVLGVLLSLATTIVRDVLLSSDGGIMDGYDLTKEYGLPLLSTAIISLVNTLLRTVVAFLTKFEMHNTYVAFERAVFRKLTVGYVLNTTILPLAVGLLPIGITPAWYEEGGIAQQSQTLILASGVGFCIFQALPPLVFLNRYVLGRYALSQPQLDRLWAAPSLNFAETYASVTKSLALCLIYAPLWPPAYGLTAVLLLFSYFCYRYAVRHWYARPPPLNETLFDELRLVLLGLLMAHIVVLHVVEAYARGASFAHFQMGRFAIMLAVCSLGVVAISPKRTVDKTGGVPYDKVEVQGGTTIERYENPAAVVARRLRKLERGVCAAMGGKQKKAEAEQKRTTVASANKGAVKLKVCRKQAHHSAQVAPAHTALGASVPAAVSAPGGAVEQGPTRSRVPAVN